MVFDQHNAERMLGKGVVSVKNACNSIGERLEFRLSENVRLVRVISEDKSWTAVSVLDLLKAGEFAFWSVVAVLALVNLQDEELCFQQFVLIQQVHIEHHITVGALATTAAKCLIPNKLTESPFSRG
jgi:hypothetical protein